MSGQAIELVDSNGQPTGKMQGTDGAGHVRPLSGTGALVRARTLITDNVTVTDSADFPAGANITEISVICIPAAVPANDYVNDNLYGVLVLDPSSDAIRDLWLHKGVNLSTALPITTTSDETFIVIPLNTEIRIQSIGASGGAFALKNGSLGGGTVGVKSSDEATKLNWFIRGA